MAQSSNRVNERVAAHYDQLDRVYRKIWGDHIHHGLWTDSARTAEDAVRELVRHVTRDARIGAGDRVCDVGCGYGAPARMWAENAGAEVVGYTLSRAQWEYARSQSGPALQFRLQDVLSNDLPGASMDAVVLIESLSHISDQEAVFQEAQRLLRPGGRLVVCAWTAPRSPASWEERYFLRPICDEGRLSGLPTSADLARWTTEAGLEVERLDELTDLVRHTWTVVLRRLLAAVVTDREVREMLLDRSLSNRVFAKTVPRIWLAQHLGTLRYGWLVAEKP